MAQRDSLYRLTDLIVIDDAYLGGNKTGKPGRGTGRTPVLVAIETTVEGKPGFVAIEVLDSASKPHIEDFAKRRLQPSAVCRTDAFPSLRGLAAQVPAHPQGLLPRGGGRMAAVGPRCHLQSQALSAQEPTTALSEPIGCRSTSTSSSIDPTAGSGNLRSQTAS